MAIMNIEHVENLNSLEKLEGLEFKGIDASLEISLLEYGMAWKDLGDSTLFIYRIDGEGENSWFDRCIFNNEMDLRKEFDWVEWDSFFDTIGIATYEKDEEDIEDPINLSFSEWRERGFQQQIFDLFNYYGKENVFGGSYWAGFKIFRKNS